MVGPLLTSKYRVPSPRAGTVPRGRLTERLTAVTRTPLTVVSAPAGFGKSTLLTESLAAMSAGRAEGRNALAWLAVDQRDNEPALFWAYVVTALQTAVEAIGQGALQLLASAAVDAALIALLNDLDGLTSDVTLVLDDYHLIESAAIHEQVALVLEHQPAQLHIVLATRSDPPLPMAQLRARGGLLELRAADLRFTPLEAAAYLNGPMQLGLSAHDVAALEGRTEGWIAALQLAALSLAGRTDPSVFIAGFAGDDRYIVDYLAEEVLARQPADVRDFLLRTSVLERLTGPLCDAVTGQEGGRAALVALERANLFLVPLDDRRQWFRYHHLFADVLHAHLLDERPGEVAGLHRRASAWFEGHDDTPAAIAHAQASGDTGRAANLMELALPTMRQQRREAEFTRWVDSLPDDVVRTRPVLGVAFAGALAQVSDFATVGERLDRAEASLLRPDGRWPEQLPPDLTVVDWDGYRSLPAHIAMYRAALALANGDLDATITHARVALVLAPPDDALARAAAGALAGIASWATGDLAGALTAYSESVAGLASIGFLADVLGCTITVGDIHRTQGRLGAALRSYRDALASTAPPPGAEPLRGTPDMHVAIAGVLVERGDFTGAREHLAVSRQLGAHLALPQNPYRWRVVLARLRAAEGDPDDALALLDEAERVYVGDYAPDVQPVAAVRARLRIGRGELAAAADWARERQVTPDDEPSYLREYEHLTLARLLLARHRVEHDAAALQQTWGLLAALLPAAERGGRGAVVIEILVLQALAAQAAHQATPPAADAASVSTPPAADAAPDALAALYRAVTLAQPEGFVRLFADEAAPMAALLKALSRQSDAPSHVRRLLAATITRATPTSSAPVLIEPLSERELDVLRLLGGDLDGPDIARELSISLNTLRTHTRNIYAKLGVSSRRTAVRQARDLTLIPGAAPADRW